MTDYHTRDGACVALAHLLRERGWILTGYLPHARNEWGYPIQSESWDGYAEHPDAPGVLVVAGYLRGKSGRAVIDHVRHTKPCERCLQTGIDPQLEEEGWTLDAARADEEGWTRAKLRAEHPTTHATMTTFAIVHRGDFTDDGRPLCVECRGTLKVLDHIEAVHRGNWRTFTEEHARGCFAHVERDGAAVKGLRGARALRDWSITIRHGEAWDAPLTPERLREWPEAATIQAAVRRILETIDAVAFGSATR